ncbi:MAG: AAA family ATPase [Spirochaetia bacterium]
MDLFSNAQSSNEPLASRMRPRNLDEFIGQEHIVGPGRLLRRAIQADQLSSLIFYGPPGTGKTTLARVIANTTKSFFITINAVLDGVKQLREAITQAKEHRDMYDRRTILFVDEVHRWNKSQQDALLPWVENGTVILIGATTENPFFEVNPALVSRSRIFQLTPLSSQERKAIALQALKDPVRGYGKYTVEVDDDALEHLVDVSSGDARSLLNAIELAVETTPENFPPKEDETIRITLEAAEESIQQKALLYDKEGDYHFDTISAFIKSIRGSDPDAVLFWLARMIRAGENPRFLFRRMLISACEDIGLGDPQAVAIVEADAAAFERVGMPEGAFHLTHAALYLATAPKSNSTLAVFDAMKAQEEEVDVPNHLKDDSRDAKGFGHGQGYLYPHAYKDHWVAQQYLPEGLQGRIFYQPSDQGYEKDIRTQVLRRREAQISAAVSESVPEVLTFSPGDSQRERWLSRTGAGVSENIADQRDLLFGLAPVPRHSRILIPKAGTLIIPGEAIRKVPEGGVWIIPVNEKIAQAVRHSTEVLSDIEKPYLLESLSQVDDEVLFDFIFSLNTFTRLSESIDLFSQVFPKTEDKGKWCIAQVLPARSTRLSGIAEKELYPEQVEMLKSAEKVIYSDPDNPLINWDKEDLLQCAEKAGFSPEEAFIKTYTEKRTIRKKDIHQWFTSGSYSRALQETATAPQRRDLYTTVENKLGNQEILWKSEMLFCKFVKTL